MSGKLEANASTAPLLMVSQGGKFEQGTSDSSSHNIDVSDVSNETADGNSFEHESGTAMAAKKAGLDVVCDNETPPASTASSQANTPTNSAKKRGLSEVIRQLHNQKTDGDEAKSTSAYDAAPSKDEHGDDQDSVGSVQKENGHSSEGEEEEESADDAESSQYDENGSSGNSGDEHSRLAAYHSNPSAPDQQTSLKRKKRKLKKKAAVCESPHSFMTPTSMERDSPVSKAKSDLLHINGGGVKSKKQSGGEGAASDAVSTGSSGISNGALSNDSHMISAADHLSAIISVAATKDLSPPPLRARADAKPNGGGSAAAGSHLTDLKNLLERANLGQYLANFTEQGGDDINQLCEADDDEFKEICDLVGMSSKPLHVRRLRKALDEYKAARGKPFAGYLGLFTNNSSSSIKNDTKPPQTGEVGPTDDQEQKGDSKGSANLYKMIQSFVSNQQGFPTPSASTSSFSSSSSTSSATSSSGFSVSNLGGNGIAENELSLSLVTGLTESGARPAVISPTILAANPSLFYQLMQSAGSNKATAEAFSQLPKSMNPSAFDALSQQQHQQQQPHLAHNKSKDDGQEGDESEELDEEDENAADGEEIEADYEEEDEEEDGTELGDEEDEDVSSMYNETTYDYDDKPSPTVVNTKKGVQSLATASSSSSLPTAAAAASKGAGYKGTSEPMNEKTQKKNKVIELYSNGERCVRRLSQLTGVPLTTVYRVIGKLKGINYNIPRGNGAGRKTILDAQDRDILVNILNTQPRISRKALGKELEKLTGKSIHNSTLNRELCRLRHHGPSSVAGSALVRGNSASAAALAATKPADELKSSHDKSAAAGGKSMSKPAGAGKFNAAMSPFAVESKAGVKSEDADQSYVIKEHAIKYCNRLADEDCKPSFDTILPDYMKPVMEYFQVVSSCAPVDLCYAKLYSFLPQMLSEWRTKYGLAVGNEIYETCLVEAAVQICLAKAPLITRPNDLLGHARRLLEECSIFDESSQPVGLKRAAKTQDDSNPRASKRAKLAEAASDNEVAAKSAKAGFPALKGQQMPPNAGGSPQLNNLSALFHLAFLQQQQQQQQQFLGNGADLLSRLPLEFLSTLASNSAAGAGFLGPAGGLLGARGRLNQEQDDEDSSEDA